MSDAFKIAFTGSEKDELGIPVPYHSYLILASGAPYIGPKAAIATILKLTEDTKAPPQTHYVVQDGTPGHATNKAVEALKKMHPGLRFWDDDNKTVT